jgi:glycosyl hydrolase group 75 (putative chitosanase)
MIRTTARANFGSAAALLLVVGAFGGCSSGTANSTGGSNGGGATAGTTSSSGGSGAHPGGSSGAGAPGASGAGGGIGAGGTSTVTGGAGGAASGGSSAGGASGGGSAGMSASGGSAGTSAGGTMGAGGSGGLGGTTNTLGTITGSPAIAKLLALVANCTTANQIPNSHTYKLDNGSTTSICSLKGGAGNVGGAIYYTADMDIDCDGITTAHCPGSGADMDCCYQDQTSFHGPNSMSNVDGTSLASENTPYVVIPQDVKFPGLDTNNGGNIIAVIYNNQLEFGVFGDTGPVDIIGEASVRTAVGLGISGSPANGGIGSGVTYIAFVGAGSQPADMENLQQIQSLGAQLTQSLLQNNP